MRRISYPLLVVLLLLLQPAMAQNAAPQTYAIIVGISQYENSGIPALNYAHRDAAAFADYLRSGSGGYVPEANMHVLIGKSATTAAVYTAMYTLLEKVKENDIVYFYFAGHGDMENTTIYKLGFLLTYNTPPNNYINNSIRMEDVNNFANTLSANRKAKVVMITDACHSGKLAGTDFRGNLLVGQQLRTAIANEIRITSCGPDELSNESQAWGGGRGVFSFYLINGLIGYAERVPDGYVRLHEIKSFIDSSLQHDAVLQSNNKKQSPVIPISPQTKEFALSKVDTVQMQRQTITFTQLPVMQAADLPAELLMNELFDALEYEEIARFDSIGHLSNVAADRVPQAFLKQYLRYIDKEQETASTSELQLLRKDAEYVSELLRKLPQSPGLVPDFNRELVLLLHTQTQQVINEYLEGSEAELERRRYYNAGLRSYDVYPQMLELAMRITEPGNFLYRTMKVNSLYFGAIARLVKLPLTANKQPLLDTAFRLLQQALAIEKESACIYNALGAVYLNRGQTANAIKQFTKATTIAPNWALPYSNLVAVYTQTRQWQQAQQMLDKARVLQPNLQELVVQAGILNEQRRNYLLAEEQHHQSIGLNSRHYLPFERLGLVYTATTRYAAADTFFHEAALRKKGFHLLPFSGKSIFPPLPGFTLLPRYCPVDTFGIADNDVLGYFSWGLRYFLVNDLLNAEKKWKRVVALDTANPLVFHYLGLLYYRQQRYAAADLHFGYAVQYYQTRDQLEADAQRLQVPNRDSATLACFIRNYIGASYKREENHYLLAAMYEAWQRYEAAAAQYRLLIQLQPAYMGAYKKLWTLLENQGRYADAEAVLLSYERIDANVFTNEISSFYERMVQRFPTDFDWRFRAGRFYHLATAGGTKFYSEDQMRLFPDATTPERVEPDVRVGGIFEEPLILPGTEEKIYYAPGLRQPYTLGITHLLVADSLMGSDDAVSADINDKLGDLYKGQGLPTYAAQRYQRSLDRQATNNSVRMKAVAMYDLTYQFSKAVHHLDYLAQQRALTFELMVLRGIYQVHQGAYAQGQAQLNEAGAQHPFLQYRVLEASGRQWLLAGKYRQAIEVYLHCLQKQPQDAMLMYSISRAYAQLNNRNQAWRWLESATEAGFNYTWVLQYDPLLQPLRSASDRWSRYLAGVQRKKYPDPTNTYPKLATPSTRQNRARRFQVN